MQYLGFLLLSLAQHLLASPLHKRDATTFSYDGDAPYSVDADILAAALTCPNGNPTTSSPPVLLVHGTGSTGQESWGNGYVPALQANGYTACYVTIPGREMGDMQVSSEYIAYNLHYLSSLSGGMQVAVIGHSQGNPDIQWALQFWPSTHGVTSAYVGLSPDFAGIALLSSNFSAFCQLGDCQPSIWQQAQGSNYYAALHAHDFQAQVPTTVIWSEVDEVVIPAQDNAQLPGATVIAVQELCPGRLTFHGTMLIDAAGFALALDALNNGGTANLLRVQSHFLSTVGTCLEVVAPHMDPTIVSELALAFNDIVDGIILGEPRVPSEPAILSYALPAN